MNCLGFPLDLFFLRLLWCADWIGMNGEKDGLNGMNVTCLNVAFSRFLRRLCLVYLSTHFLSLFTIPTRVTLYDVG
jgi:hypothetical protein